ncbi:hypothetical protein [Epidermidibacterium keratini]|uniref:hypothetical protein n=1 Tax=Epidermidibacterium keratini TaxID=1891644 RepID=UPI001CEF7029|nr:hypothetical protein [Epidermidibacterium keratini]
MPIEATFMLDDADLAVLEDALGASVVTGSEIIVSRRYNSDSMTWNVPHDTRRAVENLLQRAGIRKETLEHFKDVKGIDGVEAVCARLAGDETDTQAEKTAEEVVSIRAQLGRLDGDTAWRGAMNLLRESLPKLFYFSD